MLIVKISKRAYKLVVILMSLLVVGIAYAEDTDGYYKVDHLYSWDDGVAQVWLIGTAHTCSDQKYPTRFLLNPDQTGFSEKFSLLLSARVAGLGVKLRYQCSTSGVPYILAVRF